MSFSAINSEATVMKIGNKSQNQRLSINKRADGFQYAEDIRSLWEHFWLLLIAPPPPYICTVYTITELRSLTLTENLLDFTAITLLI